MMGAKDCKLTTTLKKLREAGACIDGYNRGIRALQGKPFTEKDKSRTRYLPYKHTEPISLLAILDANGVADCLWSLRAAVESEKDYLVRMISADIAESVLHLFTEKYPLDNRPRLAIEAARAFARGEISAESAVSAARLAESAVSAVWSAESAVSAARSAESAAWSARSAVSAAWSAESAAWSAESAAWSAESAAEKEKEKQAAIIRAWLSK